MLKTIDIKDLMEMTYHAKSAISGSAESFVVRLQAYNKHFENEQLQRCFTYKQFKDYMIALTITQSQTKDKIVLLFEFIKNVGDEHYDLAFTNFRFKKFIDCLGADVTELAFADMYMYGNCDYMFSDLTLSDILILPNVSNEFNNTSLNHLLENTSAYTFVTEGLYFKDLPHKDVVKNFYLGTISEIFLYNCFEDLEPNELCKMQIGELYFIARSYNTNEHNYKAMIVPFDTGFLEASGAVMFLEDFRYDDYRRILYTKFFENMNKYIISVLKAKGFQTKVNLLLKANVLSSYLDNDLPEQIVKNCKDKKSFVKQILNARFYKEEAPYFENVAINDLISAKLDSIFELKEYLNTNIIDQNCCFCFDFSTTLAPDPIVYYDIQYCLFILKNIGHRTKFGSFIYIKPTEYPSYEVVDYDSLESGATK